MKKKVDKLDTYKKETALTQRPPLYVNASRLQSNPLNPRQIKSARFSALVRSVKQSAKFMELRPIIVDEDGVVLGGNMRLKACLNLGWTEIPIDVAQGYTPEEKLEFIIKDNNTFGEYDIDMLGNHYEKDELLRMGMQEKELGFFMDEFEASFHQIDNTNAELPIVPKFSESYSAVMIFCDNELDENWLRNTLKITKHRDYKTERIKDCNVIKVKDFQQLWKARK